MFNIHRLDFPILKSLTLWVFPHSQAGKEVRTEFLAQRRNGDQALQQLRPGQLFHPVRAWTGAQSFTFGFYQWPPYSERFSFFCKRAGVIFGTEFDVSAAQLAVPDTYVDPYAKEEPFGSARYFEYTIEGLRTNSRYRLKVWNQSPPQEKKGEKKRNLVLVSTALSSWGRWNKR